MSTVDQQRNNAGEALAEWEVERLDVDAYLARVGYGGDLSATEDTLHALHRAHAATIPFENLDIVLGRTIPLDIESLQDKLLRHDRGGYCFEHNLLFTALLERLGYMVRRLAARVQPGKPGPRTHMLSIVEAEGAQWLADVGFGAALIEPIPFRDGAISHQGGWTHGLESREGGIWSLRSSTPDGWTDLYAFTLEPQRPIDYVVHNHYTATHPDSPFVGQIVAIRTTPEVRHTLRGRKLAIARPDGTSERRDLTDEDLPGALRQTFGITLEPDELANLGSST
ncbi:MAG: arylamine N-acetyltransferase family protein [Rubrobacteraceae bacterium]